MRQACVVTYVEESSSPKDHPMACECCVKCCGSSAAVQLLPALESGEETLVGGQAVLEGVMMRSPQAWGIAVRKPSGEIVTHSELSIVLLKNINGWVGRWCAA